MVRTVLNLTVSLATLVATTESSNENASEDQPTGRLTIVVPELASSDGTVRIYVHERPTFNSDNLKKLEGGDCLTYDVVEVIDQQAEWTTDPIPYGEYAIIVHHDNNADGVVNFGSLLPAEPIGYSNYDHAIASYPDFDKARVILDAPVLEVRVDAYMQGRLFRRHLRE